MKTSLTLYDHSSPAPTVIEVTEDPARITALLATEGIRFEQWQASIPLPPDASHEAILTAYTAHIQRLQQEEGYTAVDVVHLQPNHPDKVTLREKFLSEHIHTEDEVRFFVQGGGAFYLRPQDDRVYTVICTAGDLISVPVNVKHWFDMGADPLFTAIRLFERPDGWVAHYTGDRFADQYPAFSPLQTVA